MSLQSPITNGTRALKMYASRLEKLGIFTYEDFLYHLPHRYDDYSIISKISTLQTGETVTVIGQILEIKNQYLRGGRVRTMQKTVISDETGKIELRWFNQPFLIKTLTKGATVSASGKINLSRSGFAMISPEYEIIFDENTKPIHTGRLVPIYPETKGVSSKWLRRQIHNTYNDLGSELDEYLPSNLIKRNNLVDLRSALKKIHFPDKLEESDEGKRRLSFDELLLLQLAAFTKRQEWESKKLAQKLEVEKFKNDINKLILSLPFKLTNSQLKSLKEISADLKSKVPMNRLLQGDVGSGKTIIATVAMYLTHLNGLQSTLMAPTEILANQHFKTVSELLGPLGIKVELRTGSTKTNSSHFKSSPNILIGTHALLHDRVDFQNLGLVIIDEQQRFGVAQRGLIRERGENAHLLTMTATPIPRTIALTMYGDLSLSYLSDMPGGRKIVKTWLVPPEKRKPAYEWIRSQIIESGSQAFVICPFIDESESMTSVKAAKVEYEKLKNQFFPDLKLGILHGKLKAKEKERVLQNFRDGNIDILVATPVVEVGIDIPNATIIMIEASERFGLAQLHQLRGRVGRGDKQSYCLLFTDNNASQNSERLKGMETLYSGSELSELDLKLRGPGNLYGTAQHGIPKLKAASFSDTELIKLAKREAEIIYHDLENYPKLIEKVEKMNLKIISPD